MFRVRDGLGRKVQEQENWMGVNYTKVDNSQSDVPYWQSWFPASFSIPIVSKFCDFINCADRAISRDTLWMLQMR